MNPYEDRYSILSTLRTLIALIVLSIAGIVFSDTASAQSEWVKRVDTNNNGYIEPSELTDRSRSFFERFSREYGIDLNRPNSVRRIEDAARQYFERRSRDSSSGNALTQPSSTIKGFGIEADRVIVPDFGATAIKYPYTKADVDDGAEMLSRYDRNRDGYVSFDEVDPNRWRGPSPQACDLDGDGRLSPIELTQRYARRRMLDEQEAIQSRFTTSQPTTSMSSSRDSRYNNSDSYERGTRGESRPDRGNRALAYSILERFDLNKNGLLEPREMASVGIDVVKADYNRDGRVDRNELADYLFQEMEREGNDLSELLPTWFFEQDLNGDSQIEMSEFTLEWTAEKADEFALYDSDGDGIITSNEMLTSKHVSGGNYSNQEAQVLLPRSIVISEIQVDEDVIIGDLNVQLSITHSFVQQLDAYLISPDGTRIELFSGIGGSDDHFDRTVFDDESSTNITRARAPFRGNFQPASLIKRQPGLSSFNGKSLKGLWQLMIRSSRSDRSGVLHDWALLMKPDRESVDRMLEAEPSPEVTSNPEAAAGLKGTPDVQVGAVSDEGGRRYRGRDLD